ncbi:hypothetical protein [Halorhodospira neutriphila]|uniref:hypothetical protein n=1 Tax=Halorhodospira neutriphila TaxID=168379 RepID=UPI001903A2B7|nr:hypothetical protein [Halorhodospira neutriphila]
MTEPARSVVQGQEAGAPARVASGVDRLPLELKKVVTTSEGKLQIALESDSLSDETVEQVKELLSLQQGLVRVSFAPVQGELFDA